MEFLLDNITNVGIILFENSNVTYYNKTTEKILESVDIEHALANLFLRRTDSSLSLLSMLRDCSKNKQSTKFIVLRNKTCLKFEAVSNHSHTACYITIQRGINRLCLREVNLSHDDFRLLYANEPMQQFLNQDCYGKYLLRDLNQKLDDILPRDIDHCNIDHHFQVNIQNRDFSVRTKFIGCSDDGNPLFARIYSDISKSNSLEKQLSELTEDRTYVTSLVENAPVGLGIVQFSGERNAEGKNDIIVLYANKETLRIHKRTESMKGAHANELGAGEEVTDQWAAQYNKSKEQGKPMYFEHRYYATVKGEANVGDYWSCAMHLRDDLYIFVIQDINTVMSLEEQLKISKINLENMVYERTKQLQIASEVKSRFLATMSHELRTPLSGVIGSISLLGDSPLNVEQKELVNTAQICGQQLTFIINDILDLTKMEENRLSLESVSFSIRDIVHESIQMVALSLEKKGLQLKTDIDPKLPLRILGDSSRLCQILVNLLSNSVKFSNRGLITLTSKLKQVDGENCEIQFSVRDQGIGIPMEAQARIFQPFFQADNSVSRKYGGTGLGLNISKRLVELMKGTLWFESKENEGTSFFFTITVPIDPFPSTPQTKRRESFETDDIDYSMQILVAEDNVMNQRIIHKLLKSMGFSNIVIVENGLEAVEKAKETKFDVILMDCMMPIMSGFEATVKIRNDIESSLQPSIIALTADAFKDNAVKCIESGMNAVVTKPIDKTALLRALHAFGAKLNCKFRRN